MTAPVGAGLRERRLVVASVLAGTFIGTLNNSVANVAVLDVIDEFDVDVAAAVWFITGYVLAFAVLMPVAGRLIDRHGSRRVYLSGLGCFAVASAAIALSPTYPSAAAARVVQGIVNAPVLPAVMVTLVVAVRPEERGRAMGLWAAVNGAAIAVGPPLGGILSDTLGWRAIFWLDVPMALGALELARRHLPDSPPRHHGPLDLTAGLLLTGGLVATMVALSQAPTWGWAHPAVVGLLAAGVLALGVFGRRSRRAPDGFLDLAILRNRHYAVLAGVAGLQMLVLFAVLFIVPLLLVSEFDRGVGAAGAVVFVLPVTMVVAGPRMGAQADRHGARALTGRGAAMLVVAALVLAAGAATSVLGVVVAGLVVVGAGVSAIQSPAAVRVADHVDDAQRGVALGLFHTIRFVAGVLGTAGAAAAFTAVAGTGPVASIDDDRLARAFVTCFAIVAAVAAVALLLTRLVDDGSAAVAPHLEAV